MSNRTSRAFGIEFFLGTKKQLLNIISSGFDKPYSYIVTPNIDHVVQLQHNEELRYAYQKASYRICDSRILVPLLRSLNVDVSEVIPGSDLTVTLLEKAELERLSIVLIGAAEEDVAKLRVTYPNVRIAHYNPPMGFIKREAEIEKCIRFILDHPSDLILYAVGAPRQEVLASRLKAEQRTGVGLCVGASILFATGSLKRAPVWMQKAHLEWLHRMLSEPQRLIRRYFYDAIHILPLYLKERTRRSRVTAESTD